mgnify:CR=1 FL=1
MKARYSIKKSQGRWTVNDKDYNDLNDDELEFFNEFIIETKLDELNEANIKSIKIEL